MTWKWQEWGFQQNIISWSCILCPFAYMLNTFFSIVWICLHFSQKQRSFNRTSSSLCQKLNNPLSQVTFSFFLSFFAPASILHLVGPPLLHLWRNSSSGMRIKQDLHISSPQFTPNLKGKVILTRSLADSHFHIFPLQASSTSATVCQGHLEGNLEGKPLSWLILSVSGAG